MKEADAVRRSTGGPVTRLSLEKDLSALGVERGMTVLVHSSLSALGWVCGGAVALVLALEEVIRPYGNLVMPTHSGDLSDPSGWRHPPVPESWWYVIRETMPAFDPELTPSRGMGIIPEIFRTQEDVVRSRHPQVSFAAWGENCVEICQDHSLAYSLGEESPLARVYDKNGYILFLGTGFDTNTSFHLSEVRANYPSKKKVMCGSPLMMDGHRKWISYEDIDYDSSDFAEIGKDFEKKYKSRIREGRVGYARALLFSQRLAVDFATEWISKNRT